jgi:hypothetical protein
MKIYLQSFLVFSLLAINISAAFSQKTVSVDSTRLSAKFKFKDGFYSTIEQLRHNQPTVALSAFSGNIVQKTTENAIQLVPNQTTQSVDIQHVWGLVLNGVPYIRYQTTGSEQTSVSYQGLQIIGKLCYFSYSIEEVTTVAMPVYDPIGGRLMYTGKVKNKTQNTFRKLLNFADGTISDLTVENLKRATLDDKKLQKSVAELAATDPLQRLLKTLQVYNDRNAFFIKY